jgi:uncharacterized membrane protein
MLRISSTTKRTIIVTWTTAAIILIVHVRNVLQGATDENSDELSHATYV